jgi:hypothetical protein
LEKLLSREAFMKARCACGKLSADLPDIPVNPVACHCLDCQRRTGSAFAVGVVFPRDSIAVTGDSREYIRATASGGQCRMYFCPECGTTVYWYSDKFPNVVGVGVGAISDPKLPAPVRSVWEQSKHDWVNIESAAEHFPKGKPPQKPAQT